MIHRAGRIEVVCGSMFSGKTEELLRRVKRARIARQTVQIVKPAVDTRFYEMRVTSHSGFGDDALSVRNARAILDCLTPETTVVAVDEAQFFDMGLMDVVERLADRGLRVIAAGLDLDFRGEPFGPIPALMARAEEVTKLHAICVQCGELASRTQRLVNGQPARYDDPVIMIGASESYEARCRQCHRVPRGEIIHEEA